MFCCIFHIHLTTSRIAGLFGGVMVPAMQLGDDTLHEMQDLDSDKVSTIWDITYYSTLHLLMANYSIWIQFDLTFAFFRASLDNLTFIAKPVTTALFSTDYCPIIDTSTISFDAIVASICNIFSLAFVKS